MDTNPYAAPTARVADPEPNPYGLKRRGLVMMIVFMILTLGVYYPVWWFRRRAGLNRLNSSKKLAAWPLVLFAALFAVQVAVGVIDGITPIAEVIGSGGVLLLNLLQLAVGILMLVQTFRVKDMIEDHATPTEGSVLMSVEQVNLSGLMTFFFSIFYLQWAINRYVVADTP